MEKNRIVKITTGDKIHYEVQSKFLFWWTTETYFDYSIDGLMSGDYPHEFQTFEDAENFIENKKTKREICKIV